MSSLFDSWFGFLLWGLAYFRMRSVDRAVGHKVNPALDWLGIITNAFLIVCGVLFLTVGTYASVQSIIEQFEAGVVKGVFSCASNGI